MKCMLHLFITPMFYEMELVSYIMNRSYLSMICYLTLVEEIKKF